MYRRNINTTYDRTVKVTLIKNNVQCKKPTDDKIYAAKQFEQNHYSFRKKKKKKKKLCATRIVHKIVFSSRALVVMFSFENTLPANRLSRGRLQRCELERASSSYT